MEKLGVVKNELAWESGNYLFYVRFQATETSKRFSSISCSRSVWNLAFVRDNTPSLDECAAETGKSIDKNCSILTGWFRFHIEIIIYCFDSNVHKSTSSNGLAISLGKEESYDLYILKRVRRDKRRHIFG